VGIKRNQILAFEYQPLSKHPEAFGEIEVFITSM
jgi:hypothetical protein